MEFGRFGIKSFTAETRVNDFVKYLDQGKIMTSQCKGCGRRSFPPKAYCAPCGGEEIEWVELEGTGQIATFTTVYYGPAGFEHETPYTIAIAEFPKGIQMLGHIDKAIDKDSIDVGMKVRAVPVKRGDRCWYQFELAEHP
jgi:uncharacterized protein